MRLFTLLLSLSISLTVFAQDYKFREVSKEELQEQYNPLDSSASATYLYKNRKTFFEFQQGEGFHQVTEVHERIKLYNQEGFDYATKSMLLYHRGGVREKMSGLKAYTYNLNNGKVEETKLQKSGVFKTAYNKYWDETKFTMPNIKEGCVVEFIYKIESPFISNVDEFVFQHDIPIKKLMARFESPEYFKFKVNTKGRLVVNPINETKRDKITFNYKNRGYQSSSSPRSAGTTFNSYDEEFQKHITTYSLDNIPALKEEAYVNNINNYRSAVKYELSYTNYPNRPLKHFSTSWEDVVKTIYKNPNFGGELNKSGYYEAEVDAIIATVSSPVERAYLIFNFVKNKVKWNGYYSKYTTDGVRKAFKDQVGNVAEINLMLTSMLRYAGLDAYPVLVSTRKNGVPLFPTIEGYNYVVSYIKFPEDTILLDATNKYSMPNVLPFRALNWQGRVIAKHGGSTLINIYPSENSKNTISMMVNLSENGDIEGGYRSVKTNHNAFLYRDYYNGINEEDYLEKLENKNGGMEIFDFKATNALNLAKPLMESYKFEKEAQADIIGDKIYFSPMFFLKTDENPFKLEKREFPIDFGYPSSNKYRITINLPEGYQVESLPKSSALALPDNLGIFKYNISIKPNAIQLFVDSEINAPLISAIYYDAIKEYFNTFIQKEAEQIVLTKVKV